MRRLDKRLAIAVLALAISVALWQMATAARNTVGKAVQERNALLSIEVAVRAYHASNGTYPRSSVDLLNSKLVVLDPDQLRFTVPDVSTGIYPREILDRLHIDPNTGRCWNGPGE